MTIFVSQCTACIHFISSKDGVFTCKAFKDGIPDQFVYNKVLHNKAYDGDSGIQYEPNPTWTAI